MRIDPNGLVSELTPVAAAPFERRAGAWVEPRGGGDVAAERRARWVATAAAGDEAAFRRLLEARGLSEEEAQAGLADVSLVPGAALPGWAHALRDLLEAADARPDADALVRAERLSTGGRVLVAGEALEIPAGLGAAALAGPLAAERDALARAHPAAARLADGLADELGRSVLALLADPLAAVRFEADDPFAGWSALLRAAPALARALGVLVADWRAAAAELCVRATADREAIGEVAACHAGAGDRHDGSAVAVLELADGSSVVYKPRDLRHVDVLRGIVAAAGAADDLPLPATDQRDGYAWQQHVADRAPDGEVEWRALARRTGMWLRLFDLLGTGDVSRANVAVVGDHLVPLDVETLVPSLFFGPRELPWLPAGAGTLLLDGGLTADPGLLGDPANAPLLERLDEILGGFTELHAAFAARREAILSAVDAAADVPTRTLVRGTWVYHRLLVQSLRGAALANGVERELVLERLWRAHLLRGLPAPVVEGEVAALRDLDVPLFRFRPGGRELIGPRGRVTAEALDEPPLVRLREKLATVREAPDEADLDAVRALAFCADPAHTVPLQAVAATGDHDWLDRAHDAATTILQALRSGGPGGRRLEAGLAYVPRRGLVVLAPQRPADLLSGSAGLALVLAELGRRTGDDALLDEAARQTELTAADLRDQLDGLERGETPADGGLSWGLGASIYALGQLGSTEELRRAAQLLAGSRPLGGAEAVAGLLLAVDTWSDAPTGLGDRLVALLSMADPTAAPGRHPVEDALPSPHAAVALALGRRGLRRPALDPARRADRLVLAALGQPVPDAGEPATSLDLVVLIEEELVRRRIDPDADLARAHRAGAELLARRDHGGRWFPDHHAPDRFRLSALWGVGAVAWALAALADPRRLPLLRLLEDHP